MPQWQIKCEQQEDNPLKLAGQPISDYLNALQYPQKEWDLFIMIIWTYNQTNSKYDHIKSI